jgi:hypothetical protein
LTVAVVAAPATLGKAAIVATAVAAARRVFRFMPL